MEAGGEDGRGAALDKGIVKFHQIACCLTKGRFHDEKLTRFGQMIPNQLFHKDEAFFAPEFA